LTRARNTRRRSLIMKFASRQTERIVERNVSSAEPKLREMRKWVRKNQTVVTILQFLVGALVTFGGVAFTAFARNQFGLALGVIHLLLGLTGLAAGFVMLRAKA